MKRQRHSHIFDRERDDWYLEPRWVSERLFQEEPFDRAHPLLDPCTGTGRVADAAKAAGYRVVTADTVNRGYPGCHTQNFLDLKSAPPSIVCNPPFDRVEAFARHALEIGANKVALIFPTARIHAAHWLRVLPLRRVWFLTPRPSMPPGEVILAGGKPGGGKTDFCWIVLERGYSGYAEQRWLHRDEVSHDGA